MAWHWFKETEKDRHQLYLDQNLQWCAGTKITGVGDYNAHQIDLDAVMAKAVELHHTSVLCVTTASYETKANAWLEANGFERGPTMKNYNYEDATTDEKGRETWMWFKQIPLELFNKHRKY